MLHITSFYKKKKLSFSFLFFHFSYSTLSLLLISFIINIGERAGYEYMENKKKNKLFNFNVSLIA